MLQFVRAWFHLYWLDQPTHNLSLSKTASAVLEAVESISTSVCVLLKMFLCFAPLALSRMVPYIIRQVQTRAVAASHDYVHKISGFAIGIDIYQMFRCVMTEFSCVAQVLVVSRKDRRLVIMAALTVAIALVVVCVLLATTSSGGWILSSLFNVNDDVVSVAQTTLGVVSGNIVIFGLTRLHSGILTQKRETMSIFVASMLNFAVQMWINLSSTDVAHGAIPSSMVPIIAIYAGNITHLLVIIIWYYTRVHHKVSEDRDDGTTVVLKEAVDIFVPLTSLKFAKSLTVPMARMFLCRGLSGEKANVQIAIFSLICPVASLLISPLERLRAVYLAFRHPGDRMTNTRACIFTTFCFTVSAIVVAILCGVPDLCAEYFYTIFYIDWNLAQSCTAPLSVFIVLPFVLAVSSHVLYLLIKKRRTSVILLFTVLQLAAMPLADYIFKCMHITGAMLGASLCVTFEGVRAILLVGVALYHKYSSNENPESINI